MMKKNTNSRVYSPLFILVMLLSHIVTAQDLAINEVMASNSITIQDEDGDFSDWIEIFNYGSTPINLDGFGITDDPASLYKWIFPASAIIQPGEYMLIWASGKNRAVVGTPFHTNFKISSTGEPIILTDLAGGLVDQIPAIALQSDVSYGRQPDGIGSWLFFYTSTPGTSNIGTGLTDLLLPPTFSHQSGLYTSSFNLSITHNNPNAEIVYTLDGSEPTLDNLSGTDFNYKNEYPLSPASTPGPLLTDNFISNVYSSAINIYDKSSEPNQLATKNPHQFDLYTPPSPIRKGTVIKAKAFVNGIGSTTVSRTFFVWSQGNPYDIPVISLQIQEDHLFDYDDGVYTSGVDFDTWRANNPSNNQYYRPEWNNYWRRGRLWEYPVNIELFESNTLNPLMNVNGGLRIHGNNSRAKGIKNLRLYARSEYDNTNIFEHDLFDDLIPEATVLNNDFKRMMLRGNGTGGSVSYDVVFNRVMQPVFNGVTRIKPAIHFINGEYWGLTAIRDQMDNYHFSLNFGLDKDNIVIIDCKGNNCDLDEGLSSDYSEFIVMRDFILNNDMSDPSNYNQVSNMLDMTSFIDHMVMQVYTADDSYERKFWKVRNPENNNYGDGKWRLSTQDFEAALKTNVNWLEHWTDIAISSNEAFFLHLIANEDFKFQFINRFADLLNTVYAKEYFSDVVNFTFNEVDPYLAEDQERFPKDHFYTSTEKLNLLDWGTTRPAFQQNQIKDFFTIAEVLDFTLNVSDVNGGFVKINTIEIKESTPGVSQNPYPWVGQYFHNIPVTLEAKTLPGYTFSHWSGDVTGTNPVIGVIPTSNMQIQANFNPIENPQEVVYFWIFDKETPNNTPFENVNVSYAENGLSASISYNSCLEGYPFIPTHPNWRKASFERKNAPTELNYFPEANNNLAYSNTNMRGTQVRQPFRFGDLENNLVFNLPTTDLNNIKFSFAVMSNGAADTVLIDYWDGNQWVTDNLINPSKAVSESYQVLEFDFSGVAIANNNPNFKIRMRFDGTDMTVDNSDEVIFNNIAMLGSKVLSISAFEIPMQMKVYPNPTNNWVKVESNMEIDAIGVFNIYGQKVQSFFPKSKVSEVNLEGLTSGIYLLKIDSKKQEHTVRVVKM